MAATAQQTMQQALPWRPPLWPFRITQPTGTILRWIARIWVTIATIVFAVMALRGGIPEPLDPGTWETQVQVASLVVVALGGMLSWRWQALGASLIVLGAVVMGVLSAIEYTPLRALLVTLVFFLPAFLLWIDWQRTQSVKVIVGLALTMAIILGAAGYQANQIYLDYRGPTHPESTIAALPVSLVEWIWSGGLQPDAITVKAGLARDSNAVHLLVSQTDDLSQPIVVGPFVANLEMNQRYVTFPVQGLQPDTTYYYAVEADNEIDWSRLGTFRTPAAGSYSFTFGVGGCATTGSNGSVFDTIREHDPLFFLFNGDQFYENISVNDPNLFREAYTSILTSPAQSALHRSTPIVYMWDDHDFGPNNSDRTSPSREASQYVHREMVPTHPMAVPGDTGPIYRAFTVGRVRFIVTDDRSEKSPSSDPDNEAKSMLGEAQKEWFKQQLLDANGQYPLIVWVQSVPWIAEATVGGDTWGGYATERQEIADFIADNEIEGLLMLAGDAHMLAIDDGSNSDYATGGGAGFPIMQAAALDRPGSTKGGPFSEGMYPGGGQFGLVSIDDDGGSTVTITLEGRNYLDEVIVRYSYSVETDPVD